MKKRKSTPKIIMTITGIVTTKPKRSGDDTDKVVASMMVEVQSNKRSNYPMRIIGFDERALSLMLCRKGQKITITGKSSYWHGYQLVADSILIM